MRNLSLLSILLASVGCAAGAPQAQAPASAPASIGAEIPADASLQQAVATAMVGSHRSAKNVARNGYRHPVETLEFFGMRRDMRVVELWPGGGWYTEVLAPVLKDSGQLVLANLDADGKRGRGARNLNARLQAAPQVYGSPESVVLEPPEQVSLGEPGSADMVLTFRSSHNWTTRDALESVFAGAFAVLKQGGVLGVVQHRAAEGVDPSQSAKKGYVPESYVIAIAEKVGFSLAARSEINANPQDTKDYEKGVWTLPPSLTLGDTDREKYVGIGESDRMTLRFVKRTAPAQ